MTAIAAVIAGPEGTTDAPIKRMVEAMSSRGNEWVGLEPDAGAIATLGAGMFAWERQLTSRGGGGLVRREAVTVAADATLYYVDDLLRSLAAAGATPAGHSAPDLILAAYLAFGDECTGHLEGDFAFVLWDDARRRLLAARDFVGKRTLHYATRGEGLLIASTSTGVLATPGFRTTIDLATLASVAAGMWTHSDQTAWNGVRELRAGHLLRLEPGRVATTHEFWRPPDSMIGRRDHVDDAAAELRTLLERSTAERLAPSGPTFVSLSGGWDSTAVYASAQQAVRRKAGSGDVARGASVRAISISYPEGDPGREDDLIREVVAHWGGTTRWIDVDRIPLLDKAEERARHRDQPMAHTYEQWNRALSRGARAEGARVIFDGLGGDQLFQVSDIVLSDLFRRGRWLELRRQYRARAGGQRDLRSLYRWAVQPVLPSALLRLVAAVRRLDPPRHYLERQPPFWFREDFLARHGVESREREHRPSLPTGNAVLAEAHAFLRFPFFQRIVGMLHQFGLEEGMEIRSPLLDERVVRFAVRRPWFERAEGGETKILLRRAMRGSLPDRVLAPRTRRTGVTSAYFLRQLRGAARPVVEETLFRTVPRLAVIGMIDAALLRRAWEHVLTRDDDEMGVRLFFTLQAELWLRAHDPT